MAFTEQTAESSKDARDMADHEKTAIGAYAGLIVKRDRLLHELAEKGRSAGITVVSAPKGYGKTALVLQYASVVQADPARGGARNAGAARRRLNFARPMQKAGAPFGAPAICFAGRARLRRNRHKNIAGGERHLVGLFPSAIGFYGTIRRFMLTDNGICYQTLL